MLPDIVKVLVPAIGSFAIGMAITPVLTHYLYKYKAWKKRPGKTALDGTEAAEFNRLHETSEVRAPRMGGIVVWGSATLTIIGVALVARFVPGAAILKLDFLSRNQTKRPPAPPLVGGLARLVDDLLIIPLFILVSLAVYASGVIDGIDGLSGGVFGSIFASYAIIAFAQNQVDLAAFCASVVGGLLAFLWFNIPPARFYMSDTGTMGLTLTIAVTAFMTDSLGGGVGISVLPVIGAILVATVASDIIQVLYKKFAGKKLFLIAPLHHHFEAQGWPGYKVVMRYWVLSIVFAFAGVIIALVAI